MEVVRLIRSENVFFRVFLCSSFESVVGIDTVGCVVLCCVVLCCVCYLTELARR